MKRKAKRESCDALNDNLKICHQQQQQQQKQILWQTNEIYNPILLLFGCFNSSYFEPFCFVFTLEKREKKEKNNTRRFEDAWIHARAFFILRHSCNPSLFSLSFFSFSSILFSHSFFSLFFHFLFFLIFFFLIFPFSLPLFL